MEQENIKHASKIKEQKKKFQDIYALKHKIQIFYSYQRSEHIFQELQWLNTTDDGFRFTNILRKRYE